MIMAMGGEDWPYGWLIFVIPSVLIFVLGGVYLHFKDKWEREEERLAGRKLY